MRLIDADSLKENWRCFDHKRKLTECIDAQPTMNHAGGAPTPDSEKELERLRHELKQLENGVKISQYTEMKINEILARVCDRDIAGKWIPKRQRKRGNQDGNWISSL